MTPAPDPAPATPALSQLEAQTRLLLLLGELLAQQAALQVALLQATAAQLGAADQAAVAASVHGTRLALQRTCAALRAVGGAMLPPAPAAEPEAPAGPAAPPAAPAEAP